MKHKALLAAAAASLALAAPAAAVPKGQGLADPFPATCEGIGPVMVLETRGGGASAWDAVSGLHVVTQHIVVTSGGETLFEQHLGTKAGLETITCTAQVPVEGTLVDITATVAVVPPQ